jgi:hypothetical protein
VTTADALLASLADGLRRRVAERGQAEERLGDFVFREEPNPGSSSAARLASGEAGLASGPASWRYFITRTLAAVGEPGTLDLLERLATDGVTLDTLMRDAPLGFTGRLATADRIGGLAAAGLAGRDLESSHIRLTALGSAVLAFALEWERRAAGDGVADQRGSA